MSNVTLETIIADPEIQSLVKIADNNLKEIGYTEHSERHLMVVSTRSRELLEDLGRDDRTQELVAIAAYLHDVGNVVNRLYHAISGAILVKPILGRLGMDFDEIHRIIAAIGNHHEGEGDPVSDISAALILADKSDVHVTRVRKSGDVVSDIHDRVNFAAKESRLYVKNGGSTIGVEILIDPGVSTVMEYFQIFLERMKVCRVAAEYLEAKFELIINGVKLA